MTITITQSKRWVVCHNDEIYHFIELFANEELATGLECEVFETKTEALEKFGNKGNFEGGE